MVKMKRIAALAMSACLLVCAGGCGKKEAVSDGTVKKTGTREEILPLLFSGDKLCDALKDKV